MTTIGKLFPRVNTPECKMKFQTQSQNNLSLIVVQLFNLECSLDEKSAQSQ